PALAAAAAAARPGLDAAAEAPGRGRDPASRGDDGRSLRADAGRLPAHEALAGGRLRGKHDARPRTVAAADPLARMAGDAAAADRADAPPEQQHRAVGALAVVLRRALHEPAGARATDVDRDGVHALEAHRARAHGAHDPHRRTA